MRLFVALPVTGDAQAELTALLAEYRGTEWPVRWVKAEGLHLTMKFFGTLSTDRLDALIDALAGAVAGTPLLSLMPRELGAFPNFARARVVWAGYEAEPALELLAHRVEQATGVLGFPPEGHPFRPHVTLGRVREGAALPHAAVGRMERCVLTRGLVADRCVLYDSVNGGGGTVYTPVATYPLSA